MSGWNFWRPFLPCGGRGIQADSVQSLIAGDGGENAGEIQFVRVFLSGLWSSRDKNPLFEARTLLRAFEQRGRDSVHGDAGTLVRPSRLPRTNVDALKAQDVTFVDSEQPPPQRSKRGGGTMHRVTFVMKERLELCFPRQNSNSFSHPGERARCARVRCSFSWMRDFIFGNLKKPQYGQTVFVGC